MYDLNEFSTDKQEKTSIDSDTGNRVTDIVSSNSMFNAIFEGAKAALRFKFIALVFLVAGMFVTLALTGDFKKSVNTGKEFSTVASKDDYGGMFDFFIRKTGHRSTKFNSHPFYQTKGAKELELKFASKFGYEISLKELMAYVVYDDQDWIIMKSAARGDNNDKLVLEKWTFVGMSANEYCSKYFDGHVPDDELVNEAVKSIRIWKIKDELTEENDSGAKMFRCVIDPDTIESYLKNDRRNIQ